ncbi:MAG: endopeptidase La [Candidatus Marinimicrobia bacterium]|nr:endopeptidase La [Candidatus Neomarinimicrobiota bacterium]
MSTSKKKQKKQKISEEIKILALDNNVPFPTIIFPVVVREEQDIELIQEAISSDRLVGVFARKNSDELLDNSQDLYSVGVASLIIKMFKSTDGSVRILLRGLHRIKLNKIIHEDPYPIGKVHSQEDILGDALQTEALMRTVGELFQEILSLAPILPEEIQEIIFSIEDPSKLSDLVTSALNLKVSEKQQILEEDRLDKRLTLLVDFLQKELKIIELNTKIQERVSSSLNDAQRDYFLREQLKAIQSELGEDEFSDPELVEIQQKIATLPLSEEAKLAAKKEINRLKLMHPSSPEYAVGRNYLDWLLGLPWGKKTESTLDLKKAEHILNTDHYGLEDIKNRILEYLAILSLNKHAKSPILCFVGPPGVGKTSLGQSIAKAMGREFIRFSLGGMHDEAEIRGHRKTYIGAMPGRIIQYIQKIGVKNPLIMLDEVDKVGLDFRGDPTSALLEVLDPEQNFSFRDNYLEVSFDLSDVFFIATANQEFTIPEALLDRMEIIRLPGYITPEKIQIAKRFLIPRQLARSGLSPSHVRFTPKVIEQTIENYTMEAGVRKLEQQISQICRKIARQIAENPITPQITISTQNVENYLGPPKIFKEDIPKKDMIGVAVGLAYTESGGDVLPVEATMMEGSGSNKMTGQLGDIMKESVSTAISFIRSNAKVYGIKTNLFLDYDIHLHFPAAAIPKDGPSAGVTITTAVLSILLKKKIHHNIAMTDEISLRGRILPVGGIREKVTADRRAGIKKVILPLANKGDVALVPPDVTEGMTFYYVTHYQEIEPLIFNENIRKNTETNKKER